MNQHNLHLPNSILSLAPIQPTSTWTWVSLLDVLKSFHLGFHCLRLYNHFPIALLGDVQMAYHFPLNKLT
jgi:hypothetical protein